MLQTPVQIRVASYTVSMGWPNRKRKLKKRVVPPEPEAPMKSPSELTQICFCALRSRKRLVFPSFHEALFAVDWPVAARLEWDFRLLPALRTNGLVHLSWAEVSSLTAKSSARPVAEALFLKWHFLYLLSDSWVV